MALHLHFSDHLEGLLPVLQDSLARAWDDPMLPPRVVVPSPSTGNWLQLRLAQRMGAIANLPMLTLERFLWDCLEPSPEIGMLGASVAGQVLAVLIRKHCAGSDPLFAPLRNYLCSGLGGFDENKALQLSTRLAALLCEYEYNRPPVWNSERGVWVAHTGLDAAWLAERDFFVRGDPATEAWQRALYRELFDPKEGVFASERGASYKTLPQLYRSTLDANPRWHPSCRMPVLLAQVSKISHFHRNMLLDLSRSLEISVFLTNPCAEFWEDVSHARAGKAVRSWKSREPQIKPLRGGDYLQESLAEIKGYLPSDSDDNRLLQLWGKTGKENIALWCQAAEYDFSYVSDSASSPPESLLGQVQFAVRHRMPLVNLQCKAGDESLLFFEAPTRLREVENLRSRLLGLCSHDSGLRLDEVAVYVTDVQVYQSALEQVFGAYAPSSAEFIPYSVLGRSAAGSLVAQGMRDLLTVWGGDFSRGAVFRLLRNPLVRARLRVDREDVTIWESWVAQMGVFRGYDRVQRAACGDAAAASDEHTFGWGCARLLVGGLASGPLDLGMRMCKDDDVLGVRGFRDFETSDGNLIVKFTAALDKLAAQETRIRSVAEVSLVTQWEWLAKALEEWLAPFGALSDWDADLEKRCWKTLLDSLGLVGLQEELAGRAEPMSSDEVLATLSALVPKESPEAAKGWNGVLTIAPLRSGHILPHRHVFVLGLDGGLFPGVRAPVPLDLISSQRILGDADPVQDNRFAFLELLHAARESLSLSYLAKDILKDAELLPSSVLLELESALVEGGCPEKLPNNWVRRTIPLLSRDSRAIRWDFYESGLAALANNVDSLGVRALHRLPVGLSAASLGQMLPQRLSHGDLAVFLANPLEYHLRSRLEWRSLDEGGTLQVTDEPMELSGLEQSQFFTWLLQWMLAEPSLRKVTQAADFSELESRLDDRLRVWIDQLRHAGAMPQNWFGSAASVNLRQSAQELMRAFAAYCRKKEAVGIDKAQYVANYAWARRHVDNSPRNFHVLSLGDNLTIELAGTVPHVLLGSDTLWVLHSGSLLNEKREFLPEKALSPLLRAALVRLGGWSGRLMLLAMDYRRGYCESLQLNVDASVLESWFAEMTRQILCEGHGEHLPFRLVAENWCSLNDDAEAESEFYQGVSEALEDVDSFNGYRSYLEDWELGEPRNAFSSDPKKMVQLARSRYTWIMASLRLSSSGEEESI